MLKITTPAIVLMATLIFNQTAYAQEQKKQTDKKLQFIQQALDDEYNHSLIWQVGWTTVLGASTAMNIIGHRKEGQEPDKKYDHGVGIITSGLGFIDMFITPLRGYRYADRLEGMPQQTADEKSLKLAKAEQWLEKAAQRQREKRNWQAHASSALVNGLGAAAIAFDDNRPKDALIFFATGMIASEIKIFTAPNDLTDALNNYRNDYVAKTYRQKNYWELSSNGSNLNLSYHF